VEGAAGEETRLQRSSGGRGRQRRGTRVGQRLGRRGNELKGGKVIADGDGPSGVVGSELCIFRVRIQGLPRIIGMPFNFACILHNYINI